MRGKKKSPKHMSSKEYNNNFPSSTPKSNASTNTSQQNKKNK